MSTIGYDSWAVDLADVGAVYPFQGWEFAMFIIGLIFWIGWHVTQIRVENAEIEYEVKHNHRKENIESSVDRY